MRRFQHDEITVTDLFCGAGGSSSGLKQLDGVTFAYAPGADPVLRNVSLSVPAGSMVALVGPSGSGKSTLATLLPRFGDPDSGAVRIGGVDVRDIAPTELYRHVGFVLQDVQLLTMSVRDNIRLGRPDASDEQVNDAARAAQIHDRILELPDGYDTVVGDGAHFSGGEAQRVSIARALLADTPHTRPVPVTGSSFDKASAARYGLSSSRYQGPTGITGSIPSRSVTTLSSSPKAPAVCTRPVPSVVVTKSASTTRWAFSAPA